MPEIVRKPEPEREHERPVQTVPARQPRRRHRLARWLGALVGLLIVVIVLAAVGLHQLALDNHALGRVSNQLNQVQSQQAQFHSQIAAALASMRGTLHTISVELQILIQTVSHSI